MFKQKNNTIGMMLIEFIIAMTMSLFLVGVLCMIYLSAEKNHAAQTAYLTTQENQRIASQLLVQNLHQAGNIGCAHLTSDFPLKSYSNYTLSPNNKISGTDDTITLRGGSTAFAYLLQAMLTPSQMIVSMDLHFSPGDIVLVSDCQSAEIFQIKSVEKITSDSQKITAIMPLQRRYHQNAELHDFEINTYYVAPTHQVDASGAVIYALYIKNRNHHAIELVDGIDAIHFSYDMRDNPQTPVNQISDWSAVRGVKILLGISAINPYPLHKTAYAYARVL